MSQEKVVSERAIYRSSSLHAVQNGRSGKLDKTLNLITIKTVHRKQNYQSTIKENSCVWDYWPCQSDGGAAGTSFSQCLNRAPLVNTVSSFSPAHHHSILTTRGTVLWLHLRPTGEWMDVQQRSRTATMHLSGVLLDDMVASRLLLRNQRA